MNFVYKAHEKQFMREIFTKNTENIKYDYFHILKDENRLHENDLLPNLQKKVQ